MHSLAETIGMIGSLMLIVAYFLLQKQASGTNFTYLYLNLFGAIFILFSLYFAPNRPAIVIELFWVAISIYGIWKKRRKVNNI